MEKMTAKQLTQWLAALPAETVIYANSDWSAAQCGAVFAKVTAARESYDALYLALERADADMAGVASDCARENMSAAMADDQLGYWAELERQLANAAGQLWSDAGRSVNDELGRVIY